MRDLLNLLTETVAFQPLNAALGYLKDASGIVEEALYGYMKIEAAKLSAEGDYVMLWGGNGYVSLSIFPNAEKAAELERLLNSGDPHDEDTAFEFGNRIEDLNRAGRREDKRFAPFIVQGQIEKDYGMNFWNVGKVAFLNGKEIPAAEAERYGATLSSLLQKLAHGHH